MICRNESRDIGRALKSVLPIADQFVVVDTGSTDDTERVVRESVRVPLHFETFTGASEQNDTGDWMLQDFAAARNHAIEIAETKGCTHLMWMDADDELLDTAPILRAMYRDDVDAWNMFVQAAGAKWLHLRMWKTDKHVRFKGRCHEFPIIDGLRIEQCYATIQHHADPHASQEDANVRNLRLLMREWREKPDARTAFYIACTHRDGGRWQEAVRWFRRRIEFGPGYRDEWLFAHLYCARCYLAMRDHEHARHMARKGRAEAAEWAEFILQDANIAYADQTYLRALELARPAMDMPIMPTALWREPESYRDQAPRLISWCHEHLGNLPEAIVWAWQAARRIGKPDTEWSARMERLEAQYLAGTLTQWPVPTLHFSGSYVGIKKRRKVALVRPGAIGDILMTLNLIPAFKAAHPDTDIHYFCAAQYAKPDALLPFMLAAGCDQVLDVAGLEAWRKSYDQVINLVGYQIDWQRNERLPMDRHLLTYFAGEMGLKIEPVYFNIGNIKNDPLQVTCGKLELPTLELARPNRKRTDPYVTLQISAGWSRYKTYAIDRWQEVVASLGWLHFIHIGEIDCPRLTGRNVFDLSLGVPLAESIGIVANAQLHIGIDSFANHLTHYRWGGKRVPGVILFGSTQPEVLGYPENINLSAGLPCQQLCYRENPAISTMPRGPCVNPKRDSYADDTPWACMDVISVDQVVEAIRTQLAKGK